VEKNLAHPCLYLRFISRCQDSLIACMAWQRDVPQLLGMTQPLQVLFRSLHHLKD
jgi:hypothetical protein